MEKENNSKERGSLNHTKKLFLVTMRTLRKLFPVSWLTSGRLAVMNQRVKARRSQQIIEMATIVVVISHWKMQVKNVYVVPQRPDT